MIHLAHLETDITQACQLSCVACNHAVPLWRQHGPWRAEPAQVARDLGRLATFLHAERWGALGGEPLLHPRLVDILTIARASGIADAIEVWTNGLLLRRQPEIFWRAFDRLVLSVYPGRLTDADCAWAEDMCARFGIVLELKDERRSPSFRLWLDEPSDAALTARKFAGCFFRQYCRAASYGYFFTCCCGPHLPLLIGGQPYGTDGVCIETATEASVRAYLDRCEPLGACQRCALAEVTATPVAWREERDPVHWRAASTWGLGPAPAARERR